MLPRPWPARQWVDDLDLADRPLALPHIEHVSGGVLFLGEPVDDRLMPVGALEVWTSCTGERPLRDWDDAEEELIQDWHRAGLVVGVPPERGRSVDQLVVSPHPDDAQLALGALLAGFGGGVLGVFTEETWTRRSYYQKRPDLTSALLLAEERASCAVLGVDSMLMGHLDAEARPPWSDGFFVADPAVARQTEPELFDEVRAGLAAELGGEGPVYVPLAVGGHVDHVLIREAVLSLEASGRLDPDRLVFYEDMPYSLFSEAAETAAVVSSTSRLGELRPIVLAAGQDAMLRKRESLWVYRLQVTEGISRRVLRYGARTGGSGFAERIWVPAVAGSAALTALDIGNADMI